jgi:predicted nucleic acid-binding protein
LSFTDVEAATAAELFNTTGRRRGAFVNCMIAATALRAGASLATSNARDFRPFEAAGLKLTA